jgi:hypothetical protein
MTRAAARTNSKSTGGGGGGGDTVNDGVLQMQGGVVLDADYRPVTDQLGNESRLQLSTAGVYVTTNLGVGVLPSVSYAINTTNILSTQVHVGGLAGLYLSGYSSNHIGVFAPDNGKFQVNIGGTPVVYMDVNTNTTNIHSNASFGAAGTPPAIGSTLLGSTFVNNGEYVRLFSGHNSSFGTASYTFFATDRTFSALPTGLVASIIDIPSHTFGISNTAADTVNYRGISLAYTINNTAASQALASGINIDANITNLNGMVNRAFYYGVSGAGVGFNTFPIGIVLQNNVASTSGSNLNNSPSLDLFANGWNSTTSSSRLGGSKLYFSGLSRTTAQNGGTLNFDILSSTGAVLTNFKMGYGAGAYGGDLGLSVGNSIFLNGTSGAIASLNFLMTNGNNLTNFSQFHSGAGGGAFRFTTNGSTNITSNSNYSLVAMSNILAPAAGSLNYRQLSLDYSINASGAQSGVVTGILLNAVETNLNGYGHNLMTLQIGGASRFNITNNGAVQIASMANSAAPNSSLYFSTDASRLVWKDASGTVNNLY